MASMGDVPDVIRNKMSLCSCHKLQKNALFAFKKGNIAPFSRESLIVFREISNTSRGPTPGAGAGITKRVDTHSFAPHWLEDGVNIRVVQELMGHADVKTTEVHTNVTEKEILAVRSPLETL